MKAIKLLIATALLVTAFGGQAFASTSSNILHPHTADANWNPGGGM